MAHSQVISSSGVDARIYRHIRDLCKIFKTFFFVKDLSAAVHSAQAAVDAICQPTSHVAGIPDAMTQKFIRRYVDVGEVEASFRSAMSAEAMTDVDEMIVPDGFEDEESDSEPSEAAVASFQWPSTGWCMVTIKYVNNLYLKYGNADVPVASIPDVYAAIVRMLREFMQWDHAFLESAIEHNRACFLVANISGKNLHSPGGSTLREAITRQTKNLRVLICIFCKCSCLCRLSTCGFARIFICCLGLTQCCLFVGFSCLLPVAALEDLCFVPCCSLCER